MRVHWKAARRAWQWSQHVHRLHPRSLKVFQRHLRWATAAALRPQASLDWFAFHDEAEMAGFTHANPRLVFRALSSYMSVRWRLQDRIRVIQHTYLQIHHHSGFLVEAMQAADGLPLASFALERGQQARLRVGADAQFRKEGEVSVFLELEGVPGSVTGMAFSLVHEPEADRWVMLIGGFQGRKGGDEAVIKLATKAMHGLRPKNLLVLVAQEMARALGATSLRGVGNRIQVFRARMNQAFVPVRKIRFDFDDLWQEIGGSLREDGWFELPLATPRRTAEDIKPNKRSQYAKRYAFLDALEAQIQTRLAR